MLRTKQFIYKNFKIENKYLCFEDLGRHNYFLYNKKIILIDESKISVSDDFETFYIKTVHSLVEGYKNEIKNTIDPVIPNKDYEKIIYDISNKIKDLNI